MKIFRKDSLLIRFIDRFGDLTVLNLMFLLGCVPIITIPAAVTAMYTCTLKIAGGKEFEARWFWESLHRDFKVSLQIALALAAAGIALLADRYLLSGALRETHDIFRYVLYALLCLLACAASYAFPLAAQFKNTCAQHLKNGVLLALRHFPKTLVILALNLLPAVLLTLDFAAFIQLIVFWLLFGFAATAYVNSLFFRKIFQAFI